MRYQKEIQTKAAKNVFLHLLLNSRLALFYAISILLFGRFHFSDPSKLYSSLIFFGEISFAVAIIQTFLERLFASIPANAVDCNSTSVHQMIQDTYASNL